MYVCFIDLSVFVNSSFPFHIDQQHACQMYTKFAAYLVEHLRVPTNLVVRPQSFQVIKHSQVSSCINHVLTPLEKKKLIHFYSTCGYQNIFFFTVSLLPVQKRRHLSGKSLYTKEFIPSWLNYFGGFWGFTGGSRSLEHVLQGFIFSWVILPLSCLPKMISLCHMLMPHDVLSHHSAKWAEQLT